MSQRNRRGETTIVDYSARRNVEMTAHPVANLFPMMSDDEIADLAADIKTRGLLTPIVLDHEGRIVDGRSRLRACEVAGVEPRFETLNGHDLIAFIFRQNDKRRHLDQSLIAMVAAKAKRTKHRCPPRKKTAASVARKGDPALRAASAR